MESALHFVYCFSTYGCRRAQHVDLVVVLQAGSAEMSSEPIEAAAAEEVVADAAPATDATPTDDAAVAADAAPEEAVAPAEEAAAPAEEAAAPAEEAAAPAEEAALPAEEAAPPAEDSQVEQAPEAAPEPEQMTDLMHSCS